MINPKDRAFYNSLSRGTMNSIFPGSGGWVDIILQLPRFIFGVGSIGVRMLIRKRQGFLEFGDILKLFIHLGIILFSLYPKVLFGGMDFWGDLGYAPRFYFGLISLAIIYHYIVDFRYPKEGIEHRKEYRGRTIFSKSEIDEHRDMKLRLLDSFLTIVIGVSFIIRPETSILGLLLLIGGACLFIEEWDYNIRINSLKRNLEGSKHHIEIIDQLPTEKRKGKVDISGDDFFDASPIE